MAFISRDIGSIFDYNSFSLSAGYLHLEPVVISFSIQILS